MWIIYTVACIAAIYFMPKLMDNIYTRNSEKSNDVHKIIENNMKNMNYQQGKTYILKNKRAQKNSLKSDILAFIRKSLIISLLIAIVVIIMMVICNISLSIKSFLDIWGCFDIAAILLLLLYSKKPKFDISYAKQILQKKYIKEICQPVLEKHDYHNINIGFSCIPGTLIGLLNGDTNFTEDNSVTCDEFSYTNIRYYHERKYEDEERHIQTEEITSFYGSEIFIPCKTMIENIVRVIPSITKNNGEEDIYISKGKLGGEEHVDIEDIEFNQKFEVYSKDTHYAFWFLNSQRIEYLKQLRKKYIIAIVVKKEGLYIATNKVGKFFELPDIECENDPVEYFENNINKLETMLSEFRKIIQ